MGLRGLKQRVWTIAHTDIGILHSGSTANIGEFRRILVFMWSFGPLWKLKKAAQMIWQMQGHRKTSGSKSWNMELG